MSAAWYKSSFSLIAIVDSVPSISNTISNKIGLYEFKISSIGSSNSLMNSGYKSLLLIKLLANCSGLSPYLTSKLTSYPFISIAIFPNIFLLLTARDDVCNLGGPTGVLGLYTYYGSYGSSFTSEFV